MKGILFSVLVFARDCAIKAAPTIFIETHLLTSALMVFTVQVDALEFLNRARWKT